MTSLKLLRQSLGLVVMAFVLSHCATDFESNLECTRFALDQSDYSTAITCGTAALQADPQSATAARLLANAYLGQSNIDYLDLAEGLTDLADSTDSNFQSIANVLPSDGDLSDLRSAITTLESLDDIDDTSFTNDDLADAAFDLAIMQMIEHFAVGVYESGYFTTLDVTDITDDDAAIILDDLVDFDNRMIASGVDSTESFISEIRQTFCILEPLSAGAGFTASEYRALVGCQLSDDSAAFDTTAIDAGIANCAALNPTSQNAAVEACYDTDTSL